MRPLNNDLNNSHNCVREINNNDFKIIQKQIKAINNSMESNISIYSSNSDQSEIRIQTTANAYKDNHLDIKDGGYLTSQTLSVMEVGGFTRRMKMKYLQSSGNRRKSSVYDNAAILAKKIDLVVFADPIFYIYSFTWIGFSIAYFSTIVYLVPYGQRGHLTNEENNDLSLNIFF